MATVLDKYAKDDGFNMILDAQFWPAGPVQWANGITADVTGALVSAYNAQPPATSATAAAPANGAT